MDLRITKKRVNDHLSYDWWKYIAILLACILVWSLVFTMSAPRLHKSKNMHLVFITDNINSQDDSALLFMREQLKKYIDAPYSEIERGGYEEVNIEYPSIGADNADEATKFNTWLQVGDGDFYAFNYSEDPTKNKFENYIDNYYFSSINTLIENGLNYSKQIYNDIELYTLANPKMKKKDIQKEFEKDKITKAFVGEAALKLQGYIELYPELFYNYSRNKNILDNVGEPIEGREIEEEQIWGLNLSKLNHSKDRNKNGFLTSMKLNDDTETINVAMAVTRFEKENSPFYYNNIAVINFFIEAYHIGTIPNL